MSSLVVLGQLYLYHSANESRETYCPEDTEKCFEYKLTVFASGFVSSISRRTSSGIVGNSRPTEQDVLNRCDPTLTGNGIRNGSGNEEAARDKQLPHTKPVPRRTAVANMTEGNWNDDPPRLSSRNYRPISTGVTGPTQK
jgi:hypothetical protein